MHPAVSTAAPQDHGLLTVGGIIGDDQGSPTSSVRQGSEPDVDDASAIGSDRSVGAGVSLTEITLVWADNRDVSDCEGLRAQVHDVDTMDSAGSAYVLPAKVHRRGIE
jgi:hypothetical protein